MTRTKDLVIRILSTGRRPFGQRALANRIAGTPRPFKLVVGAHRSCAPEWIATDVSWRNKYYLDVTKKWPIPTGSVSHIYADNVIEHLTFGQSRIFLANAHEALEAGGRIRLVTPDIGSIARVYLDGPEDTRAIVLKRYRDIGVLAEHDVDLLRVPFTEHGHHRGYLWDRQSIASELQLAGLVVTGWPMVMESEDPCFRGLETRHDPASRLTQLVVEGQKPMT